MYILIDSNVALDVFLHRPRLWESSGEVLASFDDEKHVGYVTANSITDIHYQTKKGYSEEQAREKIQCLLDLVHIIDTTDYDCRWALRSPVKDFEDAVQVESAGRAKMDGIVTRNKKDFKGVNLPVWTPEEFLEKVGSRC